MMRRYCVNCKHYRDGYCIFRGKYVNEYDACNYHELSKELPLTLDGERRLVTVAAKKHLTISKKRKRGPADPLLKRLREILRLPHGYRLIKSRAVPESPLHEAVYIKDVNSGQIIRILHREDIRRLLQKAITSDINNLSLSFLSEDIRYA